MNEELVDALYGRQPNYVNIKGENMDKEAVDKLGAIVTKISVSYSRKVWSDAKGSEGAEFGLEADTPAGADIDAVGDALYAYAKAVATRNLAPDLKAHQGAAALAKAHVDEVAAVREGNATPEPAHIKMDDDGNEYEYIKVAGLSVQFTQTGKKVGKVKGGPYTKHGVTVWPEILKTVGVDLDPLEAGDYLLPALSGKTAVCLMKVGDKGKLYPEKVVEFVE